MRSIVLEHQPEPSESEVQKAAYFLWLERGRPSGQDVETWLAAKERLRHRVRAGTLPVQPRRRAPRTTLSLS